MWNQPYRKCDLESGSTPPLYPMILENPDLRWSFIGKIYTIVTIQLAMTVAAASLVFTVHLIYRFFTTTAGLVLYIILSYSLPSLFFYRCIITPKDMATERR